MEELIVAALGSVGVPAAISFYLLIRLDTALRDLTAAVNRLCQENRRG